MHARSPRRAAGRRPRTDSIRSALLAQSECASQKTIATFATSAGLDVRPGPRWIHRVAPPAVRPIAHGDHHEHHGSSSASIGYVRMPDSAVIVDARGGERDHRDRDRPRTRRLPDEEAQTVIAQLFLREDRARGEHHHHPEGDERQHRGDERRVERQERVSARTRRRPPWRGGTVDRVGCSASLSCTASTASSPRSSAPLAPNRRSRRCPRSSSSSRARSLAS
jgi:hypothetical protein